MYTSAVQKVLEHFKPLPGRPRVILLATALEWEGGEPPSDPSIFLDAVISSDADIYQVHDPVIVPSNPSIRNLHPWSINRHLDLSGVTITLSNALKLIQSSKDALQDLSLTLTSPTPRINFGNTVLPKLVRLTLSYASYWSFQQLMEADAEDVSSKRPLEEFLKAVKMPSLRDCTIDIPPWEIATSPTLLNALKSFPDLRNIQFKCSIACLSEASQHRMQATRTLITDMEARGVRATIIIDAASIRPADPLMGSRFEEWLPWYSYLREYVVKLDLLFDALQPDDEFPPDLAPHGYLDFPLLESLSLDIRQTKSKFFQASRICSKIRAPRLRHLEVNVMEANGREARGEPLLHAVLAMVTDQTSLATFRFNAPETCLVGLDKSWETMCQKLDIACAHEQWA